MLSIQALGKTSLFTGVAQASVEELWALGTVGHYEAGETWFDRGSEARELLILESGSVDLFFPVPIMGAAKEVVVEHIVPGDVVAWSALVSPYALTLSARCVESVTGRAFPRDVLNGYLSRHPEVGYQLMQNLAGVIGRRLQDFQNLWIREVQSRLAGPSA